jgi:transposase, IS5 family
MPTANLNAFPAHPQVRWRTGCEGRISCAKRDFGLARTRQDGIHGARTWCGHGIFAHNLIKIAALTG